MTLNISPCSFGKNIINGCRVNSESFGHFGDGVRFIATNFGNILYREFFASKFKVFLDGINRISASPINEEVSWVTAPFFVAPVAHRFIFRDCSVVDLVGHAMGKEVPSLEEYRSVSVREFNATPPPASARLFCMVKKFILDWGAGLKGSIAWIASFRHVPYSLTAIATTIVFLSPVGRFFHRGII